MMAFLQRLRHKIQSYIPSIRHIVSFVAILIFSSNLNFMGTSMCIIVITLCVNILPQSKLKSYLNSLILQVIPPLLVIEKMKNQILSDDVIVNFTVFSSCFIFYNVLKKSCTDLFCYILNILLYYLRSYSKTRLLIFMISLLLLTLLKVIIVALLSVRIYELTDPPSGVLRVDHYNRKVTLKRDMDHESYTHSTVYRYINEDVRLQSYLPVRDLLTAQVKWTHNGQPLVIGMHTKSYIEKRNDISFAHLDITMLQENDFGVYECWLEYDHNNAILLRKINLTLSATYHHEIQSPIGSIIGIETYIWQILKHEYVEIIIQHENRDTIAKTYDMSFSGCSPLIAIYSTCIYCPFLKNAPCYPLPHTLSYTYNTARKSMTLFCASFLSFGRYSIKIRRQIKNEETLETEYIEHEMPGVITLHPSNNFFYREAFANYSMFQDNNLKRNPNYYDEQFLYVFIIYCARLSIEFFLIFLPLTLCVGAWRLYIKYIVVPLKKIILVHQEETINILVLCHDDDSEMVHKTIVKPLEKSGYKVCFPPRDWAQYGNVPEYKIMNNAASSSDKTLLFLSQTLLSDRITMYKFLECLVIARIQSCDTDSKNVLIVTKGTCTLPEDVGRSIPQVQTTKISSNSNRLERKHLSWVVINWAKSSNYFQ